MALRLGILFRRRGKGNGGERDYDHLLTSAENVICTAAGTRLVLNVGKHYITTTAGSVIETAGSNRIQLITSK